MGDGEACYTLGNCFLQGQNGVPKDEARGQALLDRACKIIGAREPCVTF